MTKKARRRRKGAGMEIYGYALILAGYLVLAVCSRDGGMPGFRKMAQFLYRRGRELRQKITGRRNPGSDAVRRDLLLLYPFGRAEGEEEKFHVGRIRTALLVILAGDILAMASYAAAGRNMLLTGENLLAREEIGGEDRSTELEAYILQEKPAEEDGTENVPVYQGRYKLEVRSRKYGEEQLEKMAEEVFALLAERIKGENRSLDHVTGPLELPPALDGYPFSIAWESSSYGLVDSDGRVGNPGMKEGTSAKAVLTAVLTYDDGTVLGRRFENNYGVTVYPPELSPEEALSAGIRDAVRSADEESAAEPSLPLPQEILGRRLKWEEKEGGAGLSILLFFVIIAVLGAAAMRSRLHERVVERERQMRLDYPQIISKFVLYLGAGLSVRSTFARLGEDYQSQREKGLKERGAYEEILLVSRELASGVPETEAYARLGQRCRSRQYTKLCTLLTQNMRKGNRELLAVMRQEAQASLEERKNSARKLGEEAETKLLLPMVMMLAITMLIIIIPAYYSFAV